MREHRAAFDNHWKRMERDFERVKRILVPTRGDCDSKGRVLARWRLVWRGLERSRQVTCKRALDCVSAARMGAPVITANGATSTGRRIRAFQMHVAIL